METLPLNKKDECYPCLVVAAHLPCPPGALLRAPVRHPCRQKRRTGARSRPNSRPHGRHRLWKAMCNMVCQLHRFARTCLPCATEGCDSLLPTNEQAVIRRERGYRGIPLAPFPISKKVKVHLGESSRINGSPCIPASWFPE